MTHFQPNSIALEESLRVTIPKRQIAASNRVFQHQPLINPKRDESHEKEIERLGAALKKLEQENEDLSANKKVLHINKVEMLLKTNDHLRTLCSSSFSARGLVLNKGSFLSTHREIDELADLRRTVIELSKENENEYKSQTQMALAGNEASNAEYLENLKKLEKEVLIYKSQIKILEKENQALNQRIESMQNDDRIKELEDNLSTITEEKAALLQEIQKLKQSTQLAQTTSPTLTNSNDPELLRKNLSQKNSEVSELKQKLLELNKYKSQYENTCNELQRTKENLQKKTAQVEELSFKTRELRNRESENKELKRRYFLLRTVSQLFQPRIQNLNLHIEQMQKLIKIDEILDAEIEIRKLLDERDTLASQNQRLRAPLEIVFKTLEHLKQQVTGRIEDIDTLRRSLDLDHMEDSRVIGRGSPKERLSIETVGRLKLLTEKASELADFQGKIKEYDGLKESMHQMTKELKHVQDRFKKNDEI